MAIRITIVLDEHNAKKLRTLQAKMIPVCVFALKSTEKARREILLTLAFTIKSFN